MNTLAYLWVVPPLAKCYLVKCKASPLHAIYHNIKTYNFYSEFTKCPRIYKRGVLILYAFIFSLQIVEISKNFFSFFVTHFTLSAVCSIFIYMFIILKATYLMVSHYTEQTYGFSIN